MEELSVKAITKMSGLNPHTLRAWERRYGALIPRRSSSGRRVYSLKDAERLRLLMSLVGAGHAISSIAGLENEALRFLIRESAPSHLARDVEGPASASRDNGISPTALMLADLEELLEKFDLRGLQSELARARVQTTAKGFALNLVLPLMRRVGELVVDERISIAQEHAVSAIVRAHLGELLFKLSGSHLTQETTSASRGPSITLATQEGDLHEFGILVSAVVCAASNASVYYLGTSLPALPLAEAAKALSSTVVLIGLSRTPPETLKQPTERYLANVHALLDPQIELWIGGNCAFDLSLIAPGRTIQQLRTIPELESLLQELS